MFALLLFLFLLFSKTDPDGDHDVGNHQILGGDNSETATPSDTTPKIVTAEKPTRPFVTSKNPKYTAIMTSRKETTDREQKYKVRGTSEKVTQDEHVMTSQNTMTSSTEVTNEKHVMQTTAIMTSQRDATDVVNFVVIIGMTVLILGVAMFVFWKKMLDLFVILLKF